MNIRYGLIITVVVLLASCNSKVTQTNKNGLNYIKQGLYDQAIVEFNNAIITDNEWLPAYYNRAIILANLKQNQEALQDINYVIANVPDHAMAYYNRQLPGSC